MMQKMLIIGLGVIGVIIAWLYVMPYLIFLVSPFSWSEADINKNGFLSPTEADYYGSYGKRLYEDGGKNCFEYYAMKDGLTLKKTCK